MMKRMKWLLLGTALMAHAASALPLVIFTLTPPDGVLAGPQGTPVGWGYTVTTDSGYLFLKSIYFEDLTPVGTMPDETWFISSAMVSSESPLQVAWTAGLDGLQYNIDQGATVGSQTTGTLDLTYQWFENADFTGESRILEVLATNGNGTPVIAEVNVQEGAPSTVPEPGGVWLAGSAIVGWIVQTSLP